MKTNEARKLLEISENATEEEIKAAFKKLAKKHHPDKEGGDEAKFKKINEAYQTLTNPKQQHSGFEDVGFNPFGGGIHFNPFGRQHQMKHHTNIMVNVALTFNESILGCEKEIKYNRHVMCDDCGGNGFETLSDSCPVCNGKGNRTLKQGNMVFMMPCDKCGGLGKKTQDCGKCKGEGTKETDITLNVKLPGGISDTQNIRLQGAGNFIAHGFSTDVFLNCSVEKDNNMVLEGSDVISNINISLLDALQGTSIKVRTVKGEHTLKIPAKIRNAEKLSVAGYGANGGDHIFKIDVQYPENISEIINILKV